MTKQEMFIQAIMKSLRLEDNIYIMGAIEKLIERLETTDYQTFIAYLGERNSSWEKPIESIAKGVEEFYMLKTKNIRAELLEKAKVLESKLNITSGIYATHKKQQQDFFISKVKNKTTGESFIDDFEIATLKRIGTLDKIFSLRVSEYTAHEWEKKTPWIRDAILEAMILEAGLKQSVTETIEHNSAVDNKKLLGDMNIKRVDG